MYWTSQIIISQNHCSQILTKYARWKNASHETSYINWKDAVQMIKRCISKLCIYENTRKDKGQAEIVYQLVQIRRNPSSMQSGSILLIFFRLGRAKFTLLFESAYHFIVFRRYTSLSHLSKYMIFSYPWMSIKSQLISIPIFDSEWFR